MVDQLSHGRVDFGTGRSAPYEQLGMGVDPRDTREMWEESLSMIPKIWESDYFEWDGKFWKVPPRQVLPKPYQKPHPPIWVAALQPSTYELAAQKGIGTMALGVNAPSVLEPSIKQYKTAIKEATPVGSFTNNKWLSSCFGLCGEDNTAIQELSAQSLKTFFGPGRPYVQDQKDIYSRLLDQWGGVPDHLVQNFSRYVDVPSQSGNGGSGLDLSGGSALGPEGVGGVRRRHHGRAGDHRGRRPRGVHQGRQATRGHRGGPVAVPDGDGNHPSQGSDEVHRNVREARDPRLQEGRPPRRTRMPH